jgi:hypothetical protein
MPALVSKTAPLFCFGYSQAQKKIMAVALATPNRVTAFFFNPAATNYTAPVQALIHQQEETASLTFAGPFANQTGVIEVQRDGRSIRLMLPAITATANATTPITTTLPANIRPATAVTGACYVIDNSVRVVGTFDLATNGTLTLRPGSAGNANFTNTGNAGIPHTQISYFL